MSAMIIATVGLVLSLLAKGCLKWLQLRRFEREIHFQSIEEVLLNRIGPPSRMRMLRLYKVIHIKGKEPDKVIHIKGKEPDYVDGIYLTFVKLLAAAAVVALLVIGNTNAFPRLCGRALDHKKWFCGSLLLSEEKFWKCRHYERKRYENHTY